MTLKFQHIIELFNETLTDLGIPIPSESHGNADVNLHLVSTRNVIPLQYTVFTSTAFIFNFSILQVKEII